MLSNSESDYIKSLILTYKSRGYNYYLCSTISDSNDYDIVIYFSREKIISLTTDRFEVKDGIRLYIDSSAKSTYNYNDSVVSGSYSGVVTVDIGEFSYTNAKLSDSYSIATQAMSPDILENSPVNQLSMFLVILITIYIIFEVICKMFGL